MVPFLVLVILSSSSFAQEGKTYKNVVYAKADSRDLLVDVYMPASVSNPYLVVWVHGGAWHSGTKEDPPKQLLAAGYALASVDYRLSVEAPFPACIHDIKAAIRFLRANAPTYGYRADKIAIWGSSAGGHLVALVGTSNGDKFLEGKLGAHVTTSSDVQAVIDFFGPTNFTTILEQSTPHGIGVRAPALALLLGKPVEDVPDLAKKASPVFQVDPSDPPLFIAHGDQDIQVPVNQSLELEGAYEKHGLQVELEIVHGADHGSNAFFRAEVIRKVQAFLERAMRPD